MAWTAGVDRTTGALISASDWNSYLGVTGSLMYLKASPSFDGTIGIGGATPSATYPIDITATSNGVARTVRITNSGNSTAYAGFLPVSDTVTSVLASMGSGYSAPYAGKGLLQSNATAGLMIQNVNNGPIQFYVDASGATLAYYFSNAGHLLAGTDATYNIGASGGNRPNNVYAANLFSTPGTISAGTNGSTLAGTTISGSGLVISAGGLSVTGNIVSNLLFTDNTYDIGASGATRPRTGYFATALAVGTTPATGGAIRLTNADWITARNAANSNDINLLRLSSINIAEFTVHVIPTADNAIDLGGGNRWRDVYCARGAFNGSSRTLKRNISPLAAREALDAVLGTEIVRYQYNPMGEDDDHAERWHVGYIAEDAPDMLSPDHTSVTPQTTAAVAMAALQELDRRLSLVEARP